MERKFRRKKSKHSSIAFGSSKRKSTKSSVDATDGVTSSEIKHLSNISNNVFDNCCFLIICPRHDRIMLTRGNYIFFPFVPLTSIKTWYDSSIEGALYILLGQGNESRFSKLKESLPFKKFVCMHIFRFQLPQSQRFITRLIYLAVLDNSNLVSCCKNTSGCKWFPVQDAISSKIANIWGPEVSYFSNIATSNQPIVNTIVEYSLNDAFKYIPRETPTTQEEQMLNFSNVTVNDIERLYADFIEHCFPSFFFTRDSFQVYMQKHEIENNFKIIHRYYTAFRFRSKQYMQFHELLLGLAAIDARTPHGDARIKYYDYDKDGFLNHQEFKRMLKDIASLQNQKTNDQSVRYEMKKIGTVSINGQDMIDFENFHRAVGGHVFRGTSKLCRASVSPFGQITRSLATRKLCKTVSDKNLRKVLQNQRYEGTCPNCANRSFELASSLIYLNDQGTPIKYKQILPPSEIINRYSLEITFNHNSVLHFLLDKIHQFNKNKGTFKSYKGLFHNAAQGQIQSFYEDLKGICSEIAKILEKEDRVLKINDPTYVIGDIHGNLEDLLTLEQNLWKSIPFLTANYLFLGDYVDRGKWGFECFLYLMILKLLCPNKIFMLRGNHEIRCIQLKYSFHKELMKKYGNNFGQRIFDLFNYVFDRLPFCAIVNNSIFCAHGGIPYTVQNVEKLNKTTPNCIQDPEIEAISVWEIVWSDPLEYNKFGEAAEILGIPINTFNGAYLPNIKRGTSYVFNEYAVMSFLKENGLNYIIRAHEVPAPGYKFNFGTLCTTIFSCSHYCGADNECAVVFIERDGRLRIIRIDTSNNAPATSSN